MVEVVQYKRGTCRHPVAFSTYFKSNNIICVDNTICINLTFSLESGARLRLLHSFLHQSYFHPLFPGTTWFRGNAFMPLQDIGYDFFRPLSSRNQLFNFPTPLSRKVHHNRMELSSPNLILRIQAKRLFWQAGFYKWDKYYLIILSVFERGL